MGRQTAARASSEAATSCIFASISIERSVALVGARACVRACVHACVRACVVIGAKAGLIAGVRSLGVGHPSIVRAR